MSQNDALAVVADREELLRVLEGEALEKRTLVDRVADSRSTVDRSLRRLERHGIVERYEGRYRLTTVGRHLLVEYDRYQRRAEAVLSGRPVLDALPEDAEVPTAVLEDALVSEPRPNDPYGPLEQGMAALAGADHVRSVVNSGLTRYAGLFDGGLLPAEGGAELCLSTDAMRGLLNDRPEWFERAIDRPDVELLEVPDDPPYTVAVVSQDGARSVVFGVFDERGVDSGLVNDSPRAVEWADDLHDRWWEDATVVSAAER